MTFREGKETAATAGAQTAAITPAVVTKLATSIPKMQHWPRSSNVAVAPFATATHREYLVVSPLGVATNPSATQALLVASSRYLAVSSLGAPKISVSC